jgi:hypothetical protein
MGIFITVRRFSEWFFVDADSVVGSLHRVDVSGVCKIPGVHASSFDEDMYVRNFGNTAPPPLHPHDAKAEERNQLQRVL